MEGGVKTVVVALFTNGALAIAKFLAFFLTGSSSLLAEAFHSTAVTTNQGLLFYGHKSSRRRPTRTHQFGYGRERYFWSFVVSFLVFNVGALVALYEAYHKWTHPTPISSPLIAFGVITLALLLDGGSLVVALRQARREKKGSYWQYVRRTRNPEVPVVMLEDTGAVLGLLFAFAGITLTLVTGNARFDALGSAAIGILLATIAFLLAREMRSLLIGEAATEDEMAAIEEALAGDGRIRDVARVRTMYLGPEDLLVEAKVRMRPHLSVAEAAAAIDDVERDIRDRVGKARIIAIEPD